MICAVCEKCNVASCEYKFRGSYEINNKNYVQLEFRCKCGKILTKHITLEEYNKENEE